DWLRELFGSGRCRRECGGELDTQTVHDRDDGNGNTRGNKAIFNSGGAGLVFEKLHEDGHLPAPPGPRLSEIGPRSFWFLLRWRGAEATVSRRPCMLVNRESWREKFQKRIANAVNELFSPENLWLTTNYSEFIQRYTVLSRKSTNNYETCT